jgi:hypothetical protein
MQNTLGLTRIRSTLRGMVAVAVVAVLSLLAPAGSMAASSTALVDWSGDWSVVDHCTGGGCAGRDFPGTFSWTQSGGAITGASPYVFTGTASGRSAHVTGKGTGGYVAVFDVTMSADGSTFTGDWTDSQGQSGTTKGTRPAPPPAPDLALSGTVTQEDCDAQGCRREPLAGVRVAASGGTGGAKSSTTGADGSYSMRVRKGSWIITPSLRGHEFTPASRTVKVTADRAGLDFATCSRGRTGNGIQQAQQKAVVCDPDGIDWAMPARLDDQVSKWDDGSDDAPLPRSVVHPKSWRLNLFLTLKGARLKQCASGDRWRWTVTPPAGARVITRSPIVGCTPHVDVSALGTYRVRAENQKNDQKVPAGGPARVVAEDLLIVGIGDSNGSGEGNPGFQVRRCARGVTSYQFQVAEFIEHQDDHSSVTFVFASCSGAGIAHLTRTPYRGTVANERSPLSPQLDQVAVAIAGQRGVSGQPAASREVDATLVSIGVNDLSFGPVLKTCVEFGLADLAGRLLTNGEAPLTNCADARIRARFDSRNGVYDFDFPRLPGTSLRSVVAGFQAVLPDRYRELGTALRRSPTAAGTGGLGVRKMSRVFFTQYPDFSGNDSGGLCDTLGSASVAKWRPETWQWLREQSVELNGNVRRGATAIGASTVVIPTELWATHGYCAADSWFVPVLSAVGKGDPTGPFHPNATGHTLSAGFNARAVCRALRGRADCRADGEKRPGPSLPIP